MIEEIKDLMNQAKEKMEENSNEITKVKSELGEVKNYLEQNRSKPAIFVTSNEQKEVGPYLSLKSYREKVKPSQVKMSDIICHLGGGKQLDTKTLLGNANAAGGYFIEPSVSENVILQALSKSVCLQAGVKILSFDGPSVRFPAITMGSGPTWKGEGATGPATSVTVDAVNLVPMTLFSQVICSQELLQDSELVEQSIVSALNNQFAAEIDKAVLVGAGGNGPTGILNTANVLTSGATGFVVRSYISDGVYSVRNANHEPTAIVMSERSRKELQNLEDAVNAQPLMPFPYYSNIPILSTTGIPDNIATGSPSANNGSVIITGDFNQAILGIRNSLQVSVSEAGDNFSRYTVAIRMVGRFSVAILDATSFHVLTDITPR